MNTVILPARGVSTKVKVRVLPPACDVKSPVNEVESV